MITGHTVTHRAREDSIVPSEGKWRFESMFLFLKACSSLVSMADQVFLETQLK